ncbi:MAG: PQQ-binding-like beta-propeller repeat protein [Planctomycetota bacterium]
MSKKAARTADRAKAKATAKKAEPSGAKKPAAKKPAAKKPAAKKPAAKKPAAQKPPAQETPAKKTPAKKPAAKRPAAQKPPAQETPAKKTPAKKAPAKKAPAKSGPAARETAPKQPVAKKAAARSGAAARAGSGAAKRAKSGAAKRARPAKRTVLFVPEREEPRGQPFDPGPALPAWEQAGRYPSRAAMVQVRLDPPLRVLWSSTLDGPAGTEPVVSRDGVLYVADREGSLVSLDADSGERKDALRTDPIAEASPAWPLVAAGHVPRDRVPVSSPPVISGWLLLFGDDEGVFYCVRRGESTVLWRKASPLPLAARSGAAYPAPLASEGSVFVASACGHIYAADARSGRAYYRIFLRGAPTAPPALSGGRLLVVTRPLFKGEAPRLHALHPESGERLWHRDLPAEAAPRGLALTRDLALVSGAAGVFATRLRRGEPAWTTPAAALGGAPSGPLALERWRAFVARSGGVCALRCDDGEPCWSVDTRLKTEVTGLAVGGGVVWAAAGRTLLALDAESGKDLGRTTLPGAAVGSPVLAWGNLYLSLARGEVVALVPE